MLTVTVLLPSFSNRYWWMCLDRTDHMSSLMIKHMRGIHLNPVHHLRLQVFGLTWAVQLWIPMGYNIIICSGIIIRWHAKRYLILSSWGVCCPACHIEGSEPFKHRAVAADEIPICCKPAYPPKKKTQGGRWDGILRFHLVSGLHTCRSGLASIC